MASQKMCPKTTLKQYFYKKLSINYYYYYYYSSYHNVYTKLSLYTSLVRSQLIYCSQVWRPFQIKDITFIERIQRRATKYILNDYTSDYKSRLLSLNLLPLMYFFELQDIIFAVKSLKNPLKVLTSITT